MRFKPWMLAPKTKAKAGPWSALPPPVLAALTSANPSPMVRGYLINGSWPGATRATRTVPNPEPKPEPQTKPQPELTAEPSPSDEASSLCLTIRVVKPMMEEPLPNGLQREESRLERLLQRFWRRLGRAEELKKLSSH